MGSLRRTWHAAPKHVVGNLRFTGSGVFAHYLLSPTDFFYASKDDQDAVADDHTQLYRELPRRFNLEGLTVYREAKDVSRGMAVAGLPMAERRRYLESGAAGVPNLASVPDEWLHSIRHHWQPHFEGLPLRYRQGWLSLRLDFGRDGDSVLQNVGTQLAGADYDDVDLLDRYRRVAAEMAAALPSVFEPRPAAAEQIWWHWNNTVSAGVWREAMPDVAYDPNAVLDESAFTPAYFDENAAEVFGAGGISADNALVRIYRSDAENIPDSYQALLPIDKFPPGGLTFPRSMLFKLADDLSTGGVVIDWLQDCLMNHAEKLHKEMTRMNANIEDQWTQRGNAAKMDNQLPRQLFQSRELAAKAEQGSLVRGGHAGLVFRVASDDPGKVAAAVKRLKKEMARPSVGFTRWRGAQKYLAHSFIPGCEAISDMKKLRHRTTSDDMATWVPLVSSQLGDPFGVPLGLDITMPGMMDVILSDILGAPSRSQPATAWVAGAPGRGKSNCAKMLVSSWADVGARLGIMDPTTTREHERALWFVPEHKKLIIDMHKNRYSLDAVRMARKNFELIEQMKRQGVDVDEDLMPQPTDHVLGLMRFPVDSGPARRFQKHVAPQNLITEGIDDAVGLIEYIRALPRSERTHEDDQLLTELEGLTSDVHLRALFDRGLEVPDFAKYQILLWNVAWYDLQDSEQASSEHTQRDETPRQRAGRALYGLAIDTNLQMFFSRPKEQSMLVLEECYEWIQSAAGSKAAYKIMTQGRKHNTGALFIAQNMVKMFRRMGYEFITQQLNFGFKDSDVARAHLEACGRDLDRHPDLLRQYVKDTSPVHRTNRRNRSVAHLHGRVIPGREGEFWLCDEVGNFGKGRAFTHPDPRYQAAFDSNPMTSGEFDRIYRAEAS